MDKLAIKPGLILLCGLALVAPRAAAQTMPRQIEVENQSKDDAVVVTKVLYRNTEVECHLLVSRLPGEPPERQPVTPFQADGNWLQHVTILLYNQTEKTIVHTGISLWFPETGSGVAGSPMRAQNIVLGRIPDFVPIYSVSTHQRIQQDPRIEPISLASHKTLLIDVGAYIDQIAASLDNMPVAAVTKVTLRRVSAYFDDGMRWSGTTYWLPDRDHPGTYVPTDKHYFPGDGPRPWPPPVGKSPR